MQKYDTLFSCRNIYFGKNYPYFGFVAFAENESISQEFATKIEVTVFQKQTGLPFKQNN
ncbi:MAG: hypothetical protein J6W13_10355 [Salinivirgaceae bacterium]|nr:hypothetical protein [Salinivirgaceae bacterium]